MIQGCPKSLGDQGFDRAHTRACTVVGDDHLRRPDAQSQNELAAQFICGPVGMTAVPVAEQIGPVAGFQVTRQGELPEDFAGCPTGLAHGGGQACRLDTAGRGGRGRVGANHLQDRGQVSFLGPQAGNGLQRHAF